MDVPARHDDEMVDPNETLEIVTSHETKPGKLVFTERNNVDGWIATDLTVELEP